MDVLSLLRSKNRCLERFLQTSNAFLATAQQSELLPDLALFEAQREAILKAIALYDRKVHEAVAQLSAEERPRTLAQAVEASLQEKDALVHRILAIDDQILERVEAEKTKLLKDIAVNQKRTQTVQKFKSAWIPEPGEELDERL